MRLFITHARHSEPYIAEVDPACTAKLAIERLQAPDATQEGPFLPPAPSEKPYVLSLPRKSLIIPPNMAFRDAGVIDADVLQVDQKGQGA